MSEPLKWTLIILASGAGLFVLHRLLLKLEEGGHLYYWKKKANLRSVGTSMLEIQGFLEPRTRHAVEARQRTIVQKNDDGAPPPDSDEATGLVVGPMHGNVSAVPPKTPTKGWAGPT